MCTSTPAPDPNIGKAAEQNAKTSEEALQLGREQLAYTKQKDEQYAPYFEKIINNSLDQSQKNESRSDAQWQQYQNLFAPNEAQVVSDASNWDSAENIAARRGQAVQDVNTAFDVAQGTAERDLARSGADAGSGRGLSLTVANNRALAQAGAATGATLNTKLQAIQLRQQAANLGRGLPATGLAASGLATNQGQAAGGAIGQQAGIYNQGVGTALGGYGTAVQGASSAAQILQNQWNGQLTANNMQATNLGSLIGTGAGLAGMALIGSDPAIKHDIRPENSGRAAQIVMRMPMPSWRYRRGSIAGDDGRVRIGPMADYWATAVGGDGKHVDAQQAIGLALLAAKHANKEVRSLRLELKRRPK